jgi:histidinol phosphatase-like PHP family hydrolase
MAEAAQAQGYEYIALTDHSQRVAMAYLAPGNMNREQEYSR